MTTPLNTLIANMKRAISNCEMTEIGNGLFTPVELQLALNEISELRRAEQLLCAVTHPMAMDGDVDEALSFLAERNKEEG